ncbi:MAG: hypothetical protein D6704_03835, partial [Nitrospirae bacterium]
MRWRSLRHVGHLLSGVLLGVMVGGTALATDPRDYVTSHPALDYFPAPSRDGRYLAFVSERSGNPDIWLRSLASGVVSLPRQVTTHPAVDRDPALNANGTQLLYVSHKSDPRGDVYLMDLITGQEQRLTDARTGEALPQWGPAGQSVYYLKQEIGQLQYDLYRLSLPDRQERKLLDQVSAYSVGPDGLIVLVREGLLYRVRDVQDERPVLLTSPPSVDSWPMVVDRTSVVFTRYLRDTNADGHVD